MNRFFLLSVILACVVARLAAATAADFAGDWAWNKLNANGGQTPVALHVDVSSSGAISGTLNDDAGVHPLLSPAVSGTTLEFQIGYDSPGRGIINVTFQLTTDGHVTETVPPVSTAGQSVTTYLGGRKGWPVITSQPVFFYGQLTTQQLMAGSSSGVKIAVASDSAVSYQWRKDGTAIAGATGPDLTLTNLKVSDSGTYTCMVTNSVASVTSDGARLIVTDPSTTTPADTFLRPVVPTDSGYINISAPPDLSVSTLTWDSVGTDSGSVVQLAGPQAITTGRNNALTIKETMVVSFRAGATGSRPMQAQWSKNGADIPGATDDHLTLANLTVTDGATYGCTVTNTFGRSQWALTLTVERVATIHAPKIVQQPTSPIIKEGALLRLEAHATSDTVLSFQWYHNGIAVPGATDSHYVFSGTQQPGEQGSIYRVEAAALSDAGTYTCKATNADGTVQTSDVTAIVVRPGRIVNLSTRLLAGGSAGAPICGFVIGGTQPMPVVIRAVGPTLARFSLSPLPDPVVQLVRPGGAKDQYTGWDAGQTVWMNSVGAFPLDNGSKDTVAVTTLLPALYSGIVSDAHGGSGVAMLEVYDASNANPGTRFVNASTRGYVGSNDTAMITGFVISGSTSVRILIRAIGPTLAGLGVSDAVRDPKITLRRESTLVAENDDWEKAANLTDLVSAANAVGAFSLNSGTKDAALFVTLDPGLYTATVSTATGDPGTGLVEVYAVP